jgi:hypothetical protein
MYELTHGQIALSVLIKFAKYKNDPHVYSKIIPSLIERFRLGVVGYFSIRQKLIRGSYIGPCIYVGTMEGCQVEIHAKDDTVYKVVCRSISELKHMSHTLWDFIKDLNWNVLHKSDIIVKEYWDFLTRKMVKVKSSRSVHVSFREMKPISTLKSENMSLEITSYNTLRLINEEGGRRYTILSYRISNRDLGSNDTHSSDCSEIDDYLSSWLKSKPYDIKAIEDKILDEAEYEQWSCDTLRRRLIGLNKLPNLDSLFESSADTLETTSVEERRFDELSSNLASTTIDISELDSMKKMFGITDDSSSSNDDASSDYKEDHGNNVERFIREMSEEQPMVDFSWLDYFHDPLYNQMMHHHLKMKSHQLCQTSFS